MSGTVLTRVDRRDHAEPIQAGKERSIRIFDFDYEGQRLSFREPLIMELLKDEDGDFVVHSEELELHEVGGSQEEAISAAKGHLSGLWEVYVDCPGEELSEEALELRKTLKDIVESESRSAYIERIRKVQNEEAVKVEDFRKHFGMDEAE